MQKQKWIAMPLALSAFYATAADMSSLNQADLLQAQAQSASAATYTLEQGGYAPENRQNVLLPGEVHVKELLPSSGESKLPPYGANLFAGGYETERSNGLTDNYRIAAGDKVNIWLWGAVNYSNVATVDNQGNIFIPEVGPISLVNVLASQVNSVVTNEIKKVYTNSVEVYVNLLTATPVSVYLAGPVIRPGQYAGMASDSVLYFLKRAGGIDSDRGSYREIQILRNNKIIAEVDLYDFIQQGELNSPSFQDGDVILVKPQKSTITVTGGAKNPFRFELDTKIETGEQLISYAKPLAKVSHVGVVGNRATGPFSVYMSEQEFKQFELKDGDRILFNDDLRAQVIDVQLSGSYLGPSYFTVSKRTQLHDLLSHIEVDKKLANYRSIYLLRPSVAQKQKEMIDESLNRLERSVFTAPVSSDGEAAIRAKEAEMIMQFTERARQVQPLGKVIVSDGGIVANILLEQGDTIVIPNNTDVIHVGGEVLMPQAVVFNKDAVLDDYIAWAGGFTERAEDERIAIVRTNGLVDFDTKKPIQKGDQILVLPRVDTKNMQMVKDITQIIYQIAVAANVAVR